MSGITTAFNAIHTRIGALLSDHVRLSDPYSLEKNTEILLKQGYGVALGPSSANEAVEIPVVGVKRSQDKEFLISLTRQFYAKELDGAAKDVVALQLHEDLAILINDFTLEETLNDGALITDWDSEGGITTVFPDKDNFLAIQASFTATIRDVLT